MRCASFRVHCSVHKCSLFNEIRDTFLSRRYYSGELELFAMPSQFLVFTRLSKFHGAYRIIIKHIVVVKKMKKGH
jgi:hypothetical protein